MNLNWEKARWYHRWALQQFALASKAVWGYDDRFLEACRGELAVSWRALLRRWVWIGCRRREWAGFYALEWKDETLWLSHFFVHPRRQKRGIGRQMWNHMTAEAGRSTALAVSRGAAVEHQLVLHADPNARPFYEAMGAVVVDYEESPVQKGRLLPVMAFSLELPQTKQSAATRGFCPEQASRNTRSDQE